MQHEKNSGNCRWKFSPKNMYARYARLEIDFFKYIYYAKIFSSPPPLQKSRKRPWSTSKTALKAPRRSSSVMCLLPSPSSREKQNDLVILPKSGVRILTEEMLTGRFASRLTSSQTPSDYSNLKILL